MQSSSALSNLHAVIWHLIQPDNWQMPQEIFYNRHYIIRYCYVCLSMWLLSKDCLRIISSAVAQDWDENSHYLLLP